ncbi:guanine deaminase [Nakamurella panacisegetis]|uniref:Guanine deaminase n=1 Tax=Nakamurella panacisegetis TaxID=1090615 RepID=A0A1H0MRQ9_9ACTN|nr:guanine deaminase [Nakamurella panacisegetis]SDO83082.1 guanine deaminase [Nakamurella panacisegetis]
MTIYRGAIVDTSGDPFIDGAQALRADQDGGLLVRDGRIVARAAFHRVRAEAPDDEVVTLAGGLVLPGFVDTHVHFPQIRAVGGLGMPLLDWLEKCALPEESRLAEPGYAAAVADEFLDGLLAVGTTSALVFGSHFAAAMDLLFAGARARDMNVTSGLVVSDRILTADLLCTPEAAGQQSADLIDRWHGQGRLKYAVTPRFSLSTSDAVLSVCGELLDGDITFTSHLNENPAEVAAVVSLFPHRRDYLDTYHQHGLVTDRSVFAHNVHATDKELALMGETGAWASHCPTSNSALGSGLFPLRRHRAHGVGVALGSDVGAGTGLFLPKEGLQAYFMQQLLGADGSALDPVQLLFLCTLAGARALGIADRVGDFSVGKEFDAVWLRPADGSTLAVNLRHATDPVDALARVFALAAPSDVAGVWLRGAPAATTSSSHLAGGPWPPVPWPVRAGLS